jgi:hypothetical protein
MHSTMAIWACQQEIFFCVLASFGKVEDVVLIKNLALDVEGYFFWWKKPCADATPITGSIAELPLDNNWNVARLRHGNTPDIQACDLTCFYADQPTPCRQHQCSLSRKLASPRLAMIAGFFEPIKNFVER